MIHLSDSTSQIMWRRLRRPMIRWELKESSRQQVGELSAYTVLHMDGQIDQASEVAQLTQEIQSGTQTTREPVYSMTANAHGYNDIGNTYIEVDLSEQHMYFYQNGEDIFESDIVSVI